MRLKGAQGDTTSKASHNPRSYHACVFRGTSAWLVWAMTVGPIVEERSGAMRARSLTNSCHPIRNSAIEWGRNMCKTQVRSKRVRKYSSKRRFSLALNGPLGCGGRYEYCEGCSEEMCKAKCSRMENCYGVEFCCEDHCELWIVPIKGHGSTWSAAEGAGVLLFELS